MDRPKPANFDPTIEHMPMNKEPPARETSTLPPCTYRV